MEKEMVLEDLLNISLENEIDLTTRFSRIIDLLSKRLEIPQIHSKIHLELSEKEFANTGIFSFDVDRTFHNNTLNLIISTKHPDLLPFILLREAYYCFLPPLAKNQKRIQIYVNHIIEISLNSHPALDKWKAFIRKHIVDQEYKEKYERIGKFFSTFSDTPENPIRFFFEYIRQNFLTLEEKEDLYTDLFQEFMFKQSRNLYDDEIVETIRVLAIIFFKVKLFNSLSEYSDYFNEFKRKEIIKTELSLRAFQDNLRWIKKYSYIAPNYRVIKEGLTMETYVLSIQFHPYFSRSHKNIRIIIENFPFLRYPRMEYSGFSFSLVAYVFIPQIYRRDFLNSLKFMRTEGYVIRIDCIKMKSAENNLNLNYFREFHNRKLLINRVNRNYKKKYELSLNIPYTTKRSSQYSPTHFDFLVLDRIRYYSNTGFGFERRRNVVSQIKSDYLNELLSEVSQIKQLRRDLTEINNNPILKEKFIKLLQLFSKEGFFFLKKFLNSIISVNELIEKLTQRCKFFNLHEFKTYLQKNNINLFGISLEEKNLTELIKRKLLPLYFSDREDYYKQKNHYSLFLKVLEIFFNIKIFSINTIQKIIQDKRLISTIFQKKQEQLKNLHDSLKVKEFSIEKIQDTINKFLEIDPPLIQPSLLNTINTTPFAKYNIFCLLRDNSNLEKEIDELKTLFPRCIIGKGSEILNNRELIYLDIFIPNLSIKEKKRLISIFYRKFKKNLIFLSRFNFHGIMNVFSYKDFYNYESGKYFYTKDLFSQFNRFISGVFKRSIKPELPKKREIEFFSIKKDQLNMDWDNLVNYNIKENSRKKVDYDLKKLHQVEEFHSNLRENILNQKRFQDIKNRPFYNNFIDSIRFIPQFQRFGFSKYLFWGKMSNLSEIRLKSFLINTFLNIKIPPEIHPNHRSYLISYLFPFRTPNMSYFNWLINTKHKFIEFFIVYIKKFYQIIHFNYNINSNGWDLKADRFISLAKNRILNEKQITHHILIKKYALETSSDKVYGPDTIELNSLKEIYSYKPLDIKSYLGFKNHTKLDSFKFLLDKNLIYPYLKINNLGFREKFYIFIPELNNNIHDLFLELFSFFNYCVIYDVEGYYFLKGMYKKRPCRNALFVKLNLPDCAIHEFYNAFYEIFNLLGLSQYAIFHDLMNENSLMEQAFGNLSFLESYSPLKNLKWNNKDKIWMNKQLLDEKFKFLPIDL